MWTRTELKTNAKNIIKNNYWRVLLVTLIFAIVSGGFRLIDFNNDTNKTSIGSFNDLVAKIQTQTGLAESEIMMDLIITTIFVLIIGFIVFELVNAFVFNPLAVGTYSFSLKLTSNNDDSLSHLGDGFKKYGRTVGIMFVRDIYIILWSLLFVIPGIIKAYEYRMVPYILIDHPEWDRKKVFAESKRLMRNDKANAFVLDLSFILWGILSALTFGVLFVFWVGPYIFMTNAQLYVKLKEVKTRDNVATDENVSNHINLSTNNVDVYDYNKLQSHDLLKENEMGKTTSASKAKKPAAKKPAAKKTTAKKPVAKKTTAKKPVAKKTTAKKAVAKKPVAKKTTAKKPVAKKTTAKKAVAKKPVAKKTTAKKSTAKKSVAKKPVAKKTTAKKPVAKKTTAKKSTAKKPVAKKTTAKKAVAKKPVAKKTTAKKSTAKKPVAKKTTAKKTTKKSTRK